MTDSPPPAKTDPLSSDVAPSAPRLLPPSGTSAQPPYPSVVGPLPAALGGGPSYADARSPSYLFLAVVSIVSLVADIVTKAWAEKHLEGYPGNIPVWKGHLAFVLAKNKGGAWGLLQTASESVRRPFFLLVSIAAIAFIVTLYRKLTPRQTALKWGLPLVLGGALGNVFDRIRYGSVIDFIDFHVSSGGRDHHWPTFNVADIAICVGVGLMALDMFTARRGDGEAHALGTLRPMRPALEPAAPAPLPEDAAPPAPPPPPPGEAPESPNGLAPEIAPVAETK